MSEAVPPAREAPFLFTLAGVQFAHVLDFMIMMPLGPILMAALKIGPHEFGLLVAAYSFSAAGAGVLAAAVVDRFERKGFLLACLALFALATLACGLATDYTFLVVARCLAGVFGGILGSLIHTMVGDVIPFARRARASGVISSAFSLSTIAGVPFSLWLANHLGWRSPFIAIALMGAVVMLAGWRWLPTLRAHLATPHQGHPFSAAVNVLKDANHRRALLFSALVIFSGFTVIPYITLFAVSNVGIPQADIPIVYLVGGAATFVCARLIGRWADRSGKVRIYRLLALLASLPVLALTHAGPSPLWLWLIGTTSFFVLVSGRMIPAMAIIASAAEPRLRGTFMSLHGTVQSLAMALASSLAGFLITQSGSGQIEGYPLVGYVAVGANLLAIAFVSRIVMHGANGKA